MTYTPVSTIMVVHNRLTESNDVTVPVSQFIGSEAYLVVTSNLTYYPLSIGQILTFIPNIDITKPIGTAFTSLLTDAFVSHFANTAIPIQMDFNLYLNRLKVFNAFAYQDYKVHFTSINTPTILDDPTQRGYLDDLVIMSSDDMSNCLVAVNGVFHPTVLQDGNLYVLDGFKTIRTSNRTDITIVDTTKIGGHTIIPLTTTNVLQSAYQQPALVTLSAPVVGKTIFAVIDGYFYHRDQAVLSVADNTHLKIKTNRLPLIQQFRHNPRTLYAPDLYGQDASQVSRHFVDPYATLFLDQKTLPLASLGNAAFQYSRLTSFHSFLVVMNNPNLYTVDAALSPTGTPQFYEDLSNRTLSGMMNYGCGLCPSYLIDADSTNRKSIFINQQDDLIDYQDQSVNPSFIPSITKDSVKASFTPARFVDYVSA